MKKRIKRTPDSQVTYFFKQRKTLQGVTGIALHVRANYELIDRVIAPGRSAPVARVGKIVGSGGYGMYALVYTTGHPVTIRVGDQRYVLSAGQYMMPSIHESWEVANVVQPGEARRRIVYLSGSYFMEAWAALGLRPAVGLWHFDARPRPLDLLMHNALRLVFDMVQRPRVKEADVEAALARLAFYLLHAHPHDQRAALESHSAMAGAEWQDPRVRRALQFIQEHFHEPVSLDEIIRAAGWNKTDLTRGFNQTIGMRPWEFLQAFRMEEAKKILRDRPDRSDVEVAAAVGYRDVKHFREMFKRVAGVTPSEFAKHSS